jgi:hypothetical protein
MDGERRGPTWAVVALAVWACLSGVGLVLTLAAGGPRAAQVLVNAAVTAAAAGGAWFLAGRPRTPTASPGGAVVARASGWLRLGGLLAGAMGAGLWSNFLGVGRSAPGPGDVGDTGAAGVALTVAVALLASVLLLTAWGAWWFRQTLDEREATSRVLAGTTRITREQATAVRLLPVTVHAGRAGGRVPLARVVVEGPDQRGMSARAGFDATMTSTDQALAVLDRWVRARPGLVADETTRELFRSRGSLPTPT